MSRIGGTKETYYLNAIKTRTHTALFLKSLKRDGKGAYDINTINNTILDNSISSSLRLDDIYLLKNEDYIGLINIGFSASNSSSYNSELRNSDTYDEVYDIHDITSSQIQTFLYQNQIKRIHFIYDVNYPLCKNTYNSFDISDVAADGDIDTKYGKLTLDAIEIYERGNVKLIPDYRFDYKKFYSAHNPDYSLEKWDGWGMYKSDGTLATNGHWPTSDGQQWSLKKITTPLGGTIDIEYERDTYSKISGTLLDNSITHYGGNIRVKKITVKDELNNEYKTLYLYSNNTNVIGTSSGWCSVEPEFCRHSSNDFYNTNKHKLYNYPSTPVLYNVVTVLKGQLSDNTGADDYNNYYTKTVYNFTVPDRNMVIHGSIPVSISSIPVCYTHLIRDSTSQIGRINSITSYNGEDMLIGSTNFNYINDFNNMGLYTEGAIVSEINIL
ncbi:MAG: hypothetical protein HY738_19595 [Bacteroidia bacterium]|nr:hypothetical protein [Bacteroidia bacterium]